ncbi:hypothetical protein EDB84DRAFT_1443103 [Lactarius hengduanensis]|nr:hypothetical protein EDB84DRAFT_1443103 [Lactarius hengduanensis]
MANPTDNSSTPRSVPSQPHDQVRRDESPQSLAVNETTRLIQTVDEMEAEAVERQLQVEDTRMGSAVTPGGFLPKGLYTDIVNAASDAATVATLRTLQNGTLTLPRRTGAPPSHDPPSSGGNESETGDLQVFKPPPGKKRVPRPNEDKLIDEAMRKFLESEGVLATKDYFPDDADEGRVKAYEEHGLLGPDPSAPRICLKQTFKGKWNKEVVEILATNFIFAVKKGTYKAIQHTWPQMNEDKVRKRCQSKLYRTQHLCLNPKNGPKSDKINRMYQRRQETYYRRRKIHNANYHNDPATWNNVTLLLDALGTLGTSDDETDDDSEYSNPDPRFKSVRRVDIGFLNPAIAKIWAAVESYPSSLRPSRGNRAFKRISKAKSISKNRTPLPGLPINFYSPQWLQASSSRFQRGVKAEVPLPILVPYNVEDEDVDAGRVTKSGHNTAQYTRLPLIRYPYPPLFVKTRSDNRYAVPDIRYPLRARRFQTGQVLTGPSTSPLRKPGAATSTWHLTGTLACHCHLVTARKTGHDSAMMRRCRDTVCEAPSRRYDYRRGVATLRHQYGAVARHDTNNGAERPRRHGTMVLRHRRRAVALDNDCGDVALCSNTAWRCYDTDAAPSLVYK